MDWKKANRIIEDLICIVLVIILPIWILRLLKIDKLAEMKGE